jgi:tetratricopeptide (TPR) repeat protein
MYDRARDGYERSGYALGVATAVYNQAEITSRQGRFAEAEAHLRQARTSSHALGDPDLVALADRELGRLLALTGRVEEGRALLDVAREMFAQTDEAYEVLATDVEVAAALLAGGDPVAALAACDDAKARATSLDAVSLAPTISRLRGSLLLELGRDEDARAELEQGLAAAGEEGAYETGFSMLDLARAYDRLGLPGADRTRADGERLLAELGVVR